MRVLHVIPSVSEQSGGPGHAIVPMCRALQEQGIDVLLVTTDAGLNSNGRVKANNPEPQIHKGVPTIFFPVQWGDSFKYSGPLAAWLKVNIQNFDVAHVHAVFNHACIAAAKACHQSGVPYVVRPLGTIDPWSMKQKPFRKHIFWHVIAKGVLRNAAAVHYTTTGEKNNAEQSLGLSRGVVVPLGVDTALFSDTERASEFPREHPLLANHPYVLVLSRLHPKKGLDSLVDAFLPLVKERNYSKWRLVLAGDGPSDYVRHLKKRVMMNGGEEQVLFPGWLSGRLKISALQNAALVALPSHHENFGLCIIESLACGVPVLISPHVDLANEIESAGAGWVAAVDAQAIRASLAEALSSEESRATRGLAGKRLALNYQWSVTGSRLALLYQNLA